MPSIIPDPGSPPAVEPTTGWIEYNGTYSTIAAGTQIYVTDSPMIFFLLDGSEPFTNNGTLWLESNNTFAWLGRNPDVTNSGLIYLHGINVAELSGLSDYLVNSGSIFCISDIGAARVIHSDVLPVYVANSGLLAAQSLGINYTPDDAFFLKYATTIDALGNLWLVNDVPGQILAEAPDQAIAISAPSGEVHNLGLIEANATGPDGISVGVYLWDSRAGSTITNSGTIRADIAIYGAGNTPFAIDQVENQASGVIDGFVALGLGNDQFVNNGTVIGDVDMGRGEDVFSGSGSVSGSVDMGFDNDTYAGSAGADQAYGGRDNDNVGGNGGNDMLLGGFGNDNLHGDAGNDALIGEWGNDTIATSGGDYVEGGEDNDRVVLGDYSFEKVDGGTGFDTLAFAAGARAFDLSTVLATGRVAGFEALELNGGQRLVVHQGDVDALTGGTELRIAGTATDTVNLVGSWVQGVNQTIDGALFETYSLSGRTVVVSDAATVTVGGSAPAAGGLDAIAAGDAAPHPLAADYTDPATYVDYFTIFSGDFTVDSREIFFSDTVAFYSDMSEWTFTNSGQIYSVNDAYDYAGGLEMKGRVSVINNGLIHVEALRPYDPGDFHFPSIGVFMSQVPGVISLTNTGEISVYSAPYTAIGVVGGGTFHNDGLISAISENGRALGVSDVYASDPADEHQTFFNTGTIYAEGGGLGLQAYFYGDYLLPINYAAAGIAARGSLTNDGDIIAVLGANAAPDLETVGVYLLKNYGNNAVSGVTNNGTIEGTIAIKFDNVPGDFSQIGHFVTNNGQVFGDIEFQDGNDNYNGANGTMQGTVFGFGGDDTFVGGKLADSFNGGAGNDTLTGNAGDDFLEGGAGDDAINGGVGFDAASYANAAAGVTVNLTVAGAQNTGGAGTDTLTGIEDLVGSAFNDTLTGDGTGNFLIGGAGYDVLTGGAGADTLSGGSGSDIFQGTAAALDGDTITDFAVGDKIVITDATLAGFSFSVSGNTLTYTGGSLILAGLPTGEFVAHAAAGGGVELTIPATEGDDTIFGTEQDDVLNGLGGNDTITALAGNDTVQGGEGNDTLNGGSGDDTLDGGNGIDTVSYAGTVPFEVDVDLSIAGPQDTFGSGTDTLVSIENLIGSFFNDSLFGNAGANIIDGAEGNDLLVGNAGNDTLLGNTGDDVLRGGDGDDSVDGGSGVDNASYATATTGVSVSLAIAGAQNTIGAGNDTLTNIENLIGSAFNDVLTGDAGNNLLRGLDGNDTLNGGAGNDVLTGDLLLFTYAGNDTLNGGDGDDVLDGGDGNDVLDGGTGNDWASYAGEPFDGVTISLTISGPQNTGGAGTDTLTNIENLTGTDFNDTLTGDGGNNVLMGGWGNDIIDGGLGYDNMAGGLGNDRYYIDNSGDVIFEGPGEGDDTAFVLGTYTLAQGVSVETLVALNQASTDPLVLTGNEYGQSLYGNLGDNYLNGGQGADYLVGLAGNDNLLGGTGADHMQGGTGNDVYYVDQAGDLITETAGEGEDLLVATASYTLGAGVSIETMSAEQTNAAINLTGNELAQSLYGNAGNNILTGGGGADYMVGGAGNDKYYVDTSDFIGEDVGGGDDWIFVASSYTLREGNEIETLVAVNQDSLDPVNFSGNEFGQSLYGSQGANQLDGGAGNDYLVGLGGNDFLIGGAGNDNLQGGAGNDLYYVDSGDQIFEIAGEGDDLVVAFASFTLGSGQSVETLSAAEGSAAINLTGNELAQSLYGNAGNNILTTGGGPDYLVGGGGNDIFVLTNAAGVSTVADYAAGDVVDISQYLSVANGTNVVTGGYVKIVGTQLQVDANGGGDNFVTIGNVSGSGAVTIRYQSGGSPTDLSVSRSASMTAMAVAAAGMAALPDAEAKLGADTDASASATLLNPAQHTQALAPIALDDGPHASALGPIAIPSSAAHPAEAVAVHAPAMGLPATSLDTAPAAAQAPAALLAGTDATAHTAITGRTALDVPTLAIPAASQLVAGADAAQHSQIVEQVLADALDGGGSDGSDLEALLAGLASHSGAPLAGIDHLAALDGGHAFAAATPLGDAFALEAMVMHHDAPPAA